MIEIAISLAIIGFALVAIMGVLPLGMKMQGANREATLINQDSTVFLSALRNGSRGLDDLTNYVYAITNTAMIFRYGRPMKPPQTHSYGYTYSDSTVSPPFLLTNGLRIVGLMSTPEYTDANGAPIQNLSFYDFAYSNHVVAYVHSMSGPAVEKPPQSSDSLVRQDSFSYRVECVNAPVPTYMPPPWAAQSIYYPGDDVSYLTNGQISYWQANTNSLGGDVPGISPLWKRILYPEALGLNLHELQLTFLWPQQPNGSLDLGRQTFRTLVAGQFTASPVGDPTRGTNLYFFQSQSFTNAP